MAAEFNLIIYLKKGVEAAKKESYIFGKQVINCIKVVVPFSIIYRIGNKASNGINLKNL